MGIRYIYIFFKIIIAWDTGVFFLLLRAWIRLY